jgi:hypothetical protein
VRLHFNRADDASMRTGRARGAYDIYFHVTGVDGLAAQLRSRGADIVDGPPSRARRTRRGSRTPTRRTAPWPRRSPRPQGERAPSSADRSRASPSTAPI